MLKFIYGLVNDLVIDRTEFLLMKKLYNGREIIPVTPADPVVFEPNQELSAEDQVHLTKMYEQLRHTAAGAPKPRVRFTRGKGDVMYNIDATPLTPTRATMIGAGTFEERYKRQLDSFLYTKEEELNPDNLIPLMILVEASDGGKKSIRIKTGKHKLLAGKIVQCLNTFFEENSPILESMFNMFKNGLSDIQKKEENKLSEAGESV